MARPSERIAGEIRDRILRGQLRPGERVPSAREITRQWGVAIATATRVLATLREEGLVTPVPGVGTVVAEPAPAKRRTERSAAEPDLTEDRIVDTAIVLADREGLATLSMRRVAAELGVATMALYRHVPGKDELVLRMADAVIGRYPLPDEPPAGWRAQLELSSRLQWRVFREHPWVAGVLSMTRPQPLPNLLRHAEWALRALDGLGLDSETMLYVHITTFNYVRGTALNIESEEQAEERTGMTGDQWVGTQLDSFYALTKDLPTMAKVVAQDFDFQLDTLFDLGLRAILDGLAGVVEPRP